MTFLLFIFRWFLSIIITFSFLSTTGNVNNCLFITICYLRSFGFTSCWWKIFFSRPEKNKKKIIGQLTHYTYYPSQILKEKLTSTWINGNGNNLKQNSCYSLPFISGTKWQTLNSSAFASIGVQRMCIGSFSMGSLGRMSQLQSSQISFLMCIG